MKSKSPRPLLIVWLALLLAGLTTVRSFAFAEPEAPKPEIQPSTSAPADKPAEADKPAVAEVAPDAAKAEAEKTAEEAKTDEPAVTPDNPDKPATTPEKPARKNKKSPHIRPITIGSHGDHRGDNNRFSLGSDSTLAAGEKADSVISIFGSSTSAGEAGDAVVSVVGSTQVTGGTVGDAAVSVFGSTRVTGGTVGDAAVSVLGSTYVNGHVKGEVVSVLGNIEFGPDAVVDGDIVCVGGEVRRDPKATINGNVQHVALGGRYFNFDGLTAWFEQCLFYARPLAFGPHLMWAWCLALACLGFYALIALVAPQAVANCVRTLEERPGKSILAGLLTLLLTPIAYILLFFTIVIAVGVVLIPVFSLGLFFAAIFGKVVMLAFLGRRITKLFGDGPLAHPVFGVLVGGAIVLGLYTIPIVGLIVYKLLGILGLGVVVYTLLLAQRSSRAAAAASAQAAQAARLAAMPPVVAVTGETAGAVPARVAPVTMLPPVISAATLPRAGFWIRLAAALLDAVMVGIVFGMLHRLLFGFGGVYPFWYALYCVLMWGTKGSTIGGIICGLKVVRVDDRPMDWAVAIVRCLSAFLSLFVAGLGFIWVAFDDERQSWHDKIAGTTVVHVPKGTALL